MRIGGWTDFALDLAKGVIDAGAKQIANPKAADKKAQDKKAAPEAKAQGVQSNQEVKSQAITEVIVIGIGIYLLLEATR